METLKNLLGVAVYVMLSCVTVSNVFGGVRNIYYAWKTRKWKNIAFTVVVFIATIAFFCLGGYVSNFRRHLLFLL